MGNCIRARVSSDVAKYEALLDCSSCRVGITRVLDASIMFNV